MKKHVWKLLAAILLVSFMPSTKTTIYLVGDSIMANKEVNRYPETGWGMPFSKFFDSTVVVDNRAKNGRSTKSFREEGLWAPIFNQLNEGDYILIQFGHNDEVKEKVGRYTTPDEFKANLTRYVEEARSKKAIPVLITPATRRAFEANGQVKETHPVYSGLVRDVARQMNVPLIDLDEKSKEILQQVGEPHSTLLYNHLAPGEHPNYPDGVKDDTHFNELGARKMAQVVVNALRELKLDIASHIYKPAVKK